MSSETWHEIIWYKIISPQSGLGDLPCRSEYAFDGEERTEFVNEWKFKTFTRVAVA